MPTGLYGCPIDKPNSSLIRSSEMDLLPLIFISFKSENSLIDKLLFL